MRRFLTLTRFTLSILALLGILGIESAHAKENPCQEVAKICRKQGYGNGGARSSGAGLVRDCLQKVVAGQTLPGVQVRFETLSACKERWVAQKESQGRRIARSDSPQRSRRLNVNEASRSRPRISSQEETTGFVEAPHPSPQAAQIQDATR